MKKLLLGMFACTMLLVSCKKEDKAPRGTGGDTPNAKLLKDKNWRLTAVVFKTDGMPETDGYMFYKDCQKDDFFMFRSDGQNEVNQGATKCDAGTPQTSIMGSWQMTSDDKGIIFKDVLPIFNLNELTMTIVSLDEKTFKGTYTTNISGPTVYYNVTYTSVD